jgi:S-adenosylmethionine:tRNA ribosyltransferase-isomerase
MTSGPFLGFPEIPLDRIAQTPREDRAAARLMVLQRPEGTLSHGRFGDIETHLRSGDLLVLNDVTVAPARLIGRKPTGGRVEALVLGRLTAEGAGERWAALLSPRLAPETEIHFAPELSARVTGQRPDGEYELTLSTPLSPHLDRLGRIPLPPYIRRPDAAQEPTDRRYYQTVYARTDDEGFLEKSGEGHRHAVAAPTAGLHFTAELLERLRGRGVTVAFLRLYVGWGTFRPIRAADYREHKMLSETYVIPTATAEAFQSVRARGGRVWAVGTTVVRTLESALDASGRLRAGRGETGLYIHPGHRFRAVDALVTNFHMPHHTPLVLAAAFAGLDPLRRAYDAALAEGYRFLSYGDAMLIL